MELVTGPEFVDVGEGQFEPVALGQLELELGFEGPLDVDVQFGLGQAGDELGRDGHGGLPPWWWCPAVFGGRGGRGRSARSGRAPGVRTDPDRTQENP